MRIGYLECFSGISGDMLLGALVNAGVPLDVLAATAAKLNVGVRLEARTVSRGGIAATKVDVLAQGSEIRDQGSEHAHPHTHNDYELGNHAHEHAHEHDHDPAHDHDHPHEKGHEQSHGGRSHEHLHDHEHGHEAAHSHEHHRPLSTILGIIAAAELDPGVKERAARAFRLLGEVEAAIHQIPVEQVHFHEVGAVDTIADIVCAAAGAAYLGVDRWMASALNVGSGTVKCAHGTLPVPAPATLALLGDAPVYAAGPPMERVTPTGAAILRMLNVEYAALPAMRVQARGYGAGGHDTPGQSNVLRLLVGEQEETDAATESIAILETVIDDSTPQLLAYVSELLLEAGAWDVYRLPVQMKKGRTGVQMTVLCAPERLAGLREILFRETTTIGVHWRMESKLALRREFAAVSTPWGEVKMKIARAESGEVLNASPEYEDCRRIAAARGIPLKNVMQQAAQAWAASRKDEGS